MKYQNLKSLIALTLSLEMIISPVLVHAQSAEQLLNLGKSVLGAVKGTNVNPQATAAYNTQAATDKQAFTVQQTPIADKYFNATKLLNSVPGLSQYLANNKINANRLNCNTLPSSLHEARNDTCTIGVTFDTGVNPAVQEAEILAYRNQYFQVNKLYRNYLVKSNKGDQQFGVGCMQDAKDILKGFFAYRAGELGKLNTKLDAIMNTFREQSKEDLEGIEEATALLDGGSPIADKVRTRKPTLFEFGKRFENQACNSLFPSQNYNEAGKSKGLNGINKLLQDTLTTPKGKYSGASYSSSHEAVKKDINAMADSVAKQVQLNFSSIAEKGYGDFLRTLPSAIGSENGLNAALTADKFATIQANFATTNNQYRTDLSTISSELQAAGADGSGAIGQVTNMSSGNFANEVKTIENRIKNACISRQLVGNSSLDKLLGEITTPTSSKHANKNASNTLKEKIRSIMTNGATSSEKKLAELQQLDSEVGSRYMLKRQKPYEKFSLGAGDTIVTTKVSASTKVSPTTFLIDMVGNCEAQFQRNNLGNTLTGAAAIQKLKTLNQNYKTLAAKQATDIKAEVNKRLIECSSPEIANNTGIGSCTADRFDTGSSTFCANAANSCALNMQNCAKQAETKVTQFREARAVNVNTYKNKMDNNKKALVDILNSALATYMPQGPSDPMGSFFNVGFNSPQDIQREVPESDRYLKIFADATSESVDGKLLLEDPDAYLKMIKEGITKLKESVEEQQEAIIGESGPIAAHIQQTEENYNTVVAKSDELDKACFEKYTAYQDQKKQQVAQQAEAQKKLGEQRTDFCNKYNFARTNPVAACNGNIEDIVDSGTKLPGGAKAASDLASVCAKYNTESNSEKPQNGVTLCNELKKKYSSDQKVKKVCAEFNRIYDIALTGTKAEKDEECKIETTTTTETTTGTTNTPTTKGTTDCSKVIANQTELLKLLYDSKISDSSNNSDSNLDSISEAGVCVDNTNRGTNPNEGGGSAPTSGNSNPLAQGT